MESLHDHCVQSAGKTCGVWAALLLVIVSFPGPVLTAEVFEFCDNSQAFWLTIEHGARGEALAGAYSAMARGLGDVYWTPAGLAFSDGLEFTETGHLLPETEWDGYRMSFIGGSVRGSFLTDRFPFGTFAVWRRSLELLESFWYGPSQYTPRGEASVTGVSYGHRVFDGFAVGATFKRISSDWVIIDEKGYGWDIGTMLRHNVALRRLGADLRIATAGGVRNLGQVELHCDNCGAGKDRLPRRAYLGFAFTLSDQGRMPWELTLSLEETYADYLPSSKAKRGSIGLEAVLVRAFAFRYGWREKMTCYSDEKTAGVGVALRYGNLAGLSLDWARTDLRSLEDLERWTFSASLFRCSRGLDLKSLFVK